MAFEVYLAKCTNSSREKYKYVNTEWEGHVAWSLPRGGLVVFSDQFENLVVPFLSHVHIAMGISSLFFQAILKYLSKYV